MNRDWMQRTIKALAISVVFAQLSLGQGVFDDGAGPDANDFAEFTDASSQPTAEQLQAIAEQVQRINGEARALAEQGNLDAAILKYEEALAVENSPGNFESHFERGRLLREKGYVSDALQAFGLAQSFARDQEPPALVAYYLELGQAYLDTEQFNTAISIFEGAINQLPGQTRNSELWFQLGVAQSEFAQSQQFSTPQQQAEDLQKALNAFDRAIDVNPNYPEALFERGMTHSMLGDIDKSIDDLEKAVELDPSNEVSDWAIGVCLVKSRTQ